MFSAGVVHLFVCTNLAASCGVYASVCLVAAELRGSEILLLTSFGKFYRGSGDREDVGV